MKLITLILIILTKNKMKIFKVENSISEQKSKFFSLSLRILQEKLKKYIFIK